jgi:hypothetical protein
MSKLEPCATCASKDLCGYEEMACMAFVGFVCRNDYYQEDKKDPSAYIFNVIFNNISEQPMFWMYNSHMNQKRKAQNV